MGATSFLTTNTGPSAKAAFDDAVSLARYMADGDDEDPCSDIGDKTSFTMIPLPAGIDPADGQAVAEAAMALIVANDPRIEDKWGPAGCFDLGPAADAGAGHRAYLFFGWVPE